MTLSSVLSNNATLDIARTVSPPPTPADNAESAIHFQIENDHRNVLWQNEAAPPASPNNLHEFPRHCKETPWHEHNRKAHHTQHESSLTLCEGEKLNRPNFAALAELSHEHEDVCGKSARYPAAAQGTPADTKTPANLLC